MEKEVINLIKVKIIKLRSFIFYIIVAIILICLTAMFIKIYENSYRTTPAFSNIKPNNNTKNFIYKIDDSIFKKLFSLSIPVLDVVLEKKTINRFSKYNRCYFTFAYKYRHSKSGNIFFNALTYHEFNGNSGGYDTGGGTATAK